MTRGTGCLLIEENKSLVIYFTDEFNGDMYFEDGYGEEFLHAVNGANDNFQFMSNAVRFNAKHHRYEEFEVNRHLIEKVGEDFYSFDGENHVIDFSKKYFEIWFSDYIFFKNCTDKAIKFIGKNEHGVKEYLLEPKEACAFYFGDTEKVFTINEDNKWEEYYWEEE